MTLDKLIKLPEPEMWLANAVISLLYQWKSQALPGPLVIAEMDLDALTKYKQELYQSYKNSKESLERQGFIVQPSKGK